MRPATRGVYQEHDDDYTVATSEDYSVHQEHDSDSVVSTSEDYSVSARL